ncbi:MAG: prepilin peptidase [Streptosporangiales bacterium]
MITVALAMLALPTGAALGWLLAPLLSARVPAGEHIATHRRLAAALTGVAFGLLAWRFGPEPELIAYLVLVAGCVPLAIIDARAGRLPNKLTLSTFAAGLLLLAANAALGVAGWTALAGALIGAAALAGMYLVLALANPSGMGLGDVKLALPLGLYLGWLGAATWMLGALLGAMFGALAALALLASRRASWRSRLPYGPFMVAGAFTAIAVAPLIPELGVSLA